MQYRGIGICKIVSMHMHAPPPKQAQKLKSVMHLQYVQIELDPAEIQQWIPF